MTKVTEAITRQWERLSQLPAAVARTVRELAQPESRTRTTAIQISKATAAAIVAWYIAEELLGSEAAWLAPVTAVLMVHSTGYRSLAEGVKRVVAVAAGVVLAAAVGNLLGLSALGLLLVVPLSLLGARLRWIGAQGEYIAITAVLLLTFGVATDQNFLLAYVSDTLLGAATGALINLFVFPPAFQRSTHAAVRDLATHTAAVLRDVAEGARSDWDRDEADRWHRRASRLDDEAQAAQTALAWNREGLRYNPWRRRDDRPSAHYQPAVDTLWHIAIEVRSLTRSLRDNLPSDGETQLHQEVPPLVDDLAPLLESAAEVVDTFGDDPVVTDGRLSEPVRASLSRADELFHDMAQRIPQAGTPAPEAYAAAGSTLELVGRILSFLRTLDQDDQPAASDDQR